MAAAAHAGHDTITYWMVRAEADYGRADGADVWGWTPTRGSAATPLNSVWTSSGEAHDGAVETAEIEALYTVPVSDFRGQGACAMIEPDGHAYLDCWGDRPRPISRGRGGVSERGRRSVGAADAGA